MEPSGIADIKRGGAGEEALHKIDIALYELEYLKSFSQDLPKGAKVKIKDEDLQRIEDCFYNLRLAARGINNIRADLKARGAPKTSPTKRE